MKNIHLIPTDKPSRLFKDDFGKLFYSINIDQEQNHFKPQNIYITSSNEELKQGDWCCNIISKTKFKATKELIDLINDPNVTLTTNKKIILTTDQDLIKDGVQAIDDEFLEWFVNNPSCEEVEVKTRYVHYYKTGETFISLSKTPEFSSRNMQCIKIEPRYEIIIPKEEQMAHNGLTQKQTAVEWLVNEIESKNDKYFASYFSEFIAQAKKMEKQQIIDAYHINPLETKWKNIGEQYYNETFKKK